ncbi:helix-turn-helix domain-containing protein [Paenibacillus daejeonensis]|uniref:helix-turn-helix domain-containing protein n=1 Tax=Paenibacillus daejeonensis TaxID=135193 RepID=UPI000371A847|nr:helix-turn-helix domain-containing protein [Paenibacillus daejeonensis]
MHRKSLFVKMILFGCVLSIIPVVFIGAFSYIQSSKQVQNRVNQGEVQFLRQVNSNIELVLQTVEHTMIKMADSQVMEDALYNKLEAVNFQLYNNLRSEIVHLQSFDTKVEEVIVYNARQDWLVRNSGIKRLSEYPDRDTFLSYLDMEYPAAWTLLSKQDFAEAISSHTCPHLISFMIKLPNAPTGKYGLAMANIPACSIAAMITDSDQPGEVIVLNKERQIMVHRDTAQIGTRLSDHPVLASDIEFADTDGQLQVEHNNQAYSLTYYKSPFNDWIYLSLVSIEHLTKESRQIGWLTVFICLGIIGFSILFVWLGTRNLYSPFDRLMQMIGGRPFDRTSAPKSEVQVIEEHIKHLFHSNSRLEHEIRNHAQQISSLFLYRWFSGSLHPSEIDEKLTYFGFRELAGTWKLMTVLAIQVDTLDNTRYETQDSELLLFATMNIAEELIPASNRLPVVMMDRSLVILVGYDLDEMEAVEEAFSQLAGEVMAAVEKYLKLSISVGIALPYQDIMLTPRAHQEALEALRHRLRLGKGVIIPFSSVNSGKPSVIYEYPDRTEHELMDAIRTANEAEALQALGNWMEEATQAVSHPESYQISVVRLLNRLLIVGQEAGVSFGKTGTHKASVYEEVLSLHVSEEIEEWFKEKLVIPLVTIFGERSESQDRKLSEKIIHLIQHHYDTEFTLEDCAAKLHYNPSYLSSVFKKETGHTFSSYLAIYRLQLAKQWLTETDMTVKDIADRLRYTNSHNFIRAFRKQEGMTPGQYRSQYAKA